MNTTEKQPVILTEEDYRLLKKYCPQSSDQTDEMSLAYELARAIVVTKDAFPPHCIRIGSSITIMDIATQKTKAFTITLPEQADIKAHKVSVLSPMAAAVIGFRKGEAVTWKVPGGIKEFRILEVVNAG